MAIDAQIASMFAQADAQGLSLAEVLTQVSQYKALHTESDPTTPGGTPPFYIEPTADFEAWISWLGDISTSGTYGLTMAYETAWNRAWAYLHVQKAGQNNSLWLLYILTLIRIIQRDTVSAGPNLAKYSLQSVALGGKAKV